jgi:phosphohistidine phosphatase
MRHAKSDWATPTEGDFDRPLNKRGRRSARALGNWLRERALQPGEALVSSARRTQETWERLEIRSCRVWFLDHLYHASAGQMLAALRRAEADCVLMIGHNPGIASFAEELTGAANDLPTDFHRYPTGATAVIRWSAKTWSQVDPGSGTLVDFVIPRDLGED